MVCISHICVQGVGQRCAGLARPAETVQYIIISVVSDASEGSLKVSGGLTVSGRSVATPLSVEGMWRPHCQWKVCGDPTVSRSVATPLTHRQWKVSGDPTVSGRSVATALSVEGQWRPHCQWKVSGDTTVSGRSVATPLLVEDQWRHHC